MWGSVALLIGVIKCDVNQKFISVGGISSLPHNYDHITSMVVLHIQVFYEIRLES